jgi:hypothetical protein
MFISANVGNGKLFLIEGCNFASCGYIGDDEIGGVIVVSSSSISTEYSLKVLNSNFTSFFGMYGSVFRFVFYIKEYIYIYYLINNLNVCEFIYYYYYFLFYYLN